MAAYFHQDLLSLDLIEYFASSSKGANDNQYQHSIPYFFTVPQTFHHYHNNYYNLLSGLSLRFQVAE